MDAKELSRQMKETLEKITPEERRKAEETMQKLEAQGFFLLCGCSVGEKERPTNGQKGLEQSSEN